MKEIELTQGKVALVSDEDYDWAQQWKWYFDKGYAFRTRQKADGPGVKNIRMHREIIEKRMGIVLTNGQCDHKDRNGLKNTRDNLRTATQQENSMNKGKKEGTSSRFKGVSWHKVAGKWRVDMKYNGKALYLGLYCKEDEAAKVYDIWAKRLRGDFAVLNRDLVKNF